MLPTLAEGSASVISEALAAGLPVITTHSAGSIIVHEDSGLLVPERNAEALASAIERIVTNRACRDALASGARVAAQELSEGEWSKRLLTALTGASKTPHENRIPNPLMVHGRVS